eukprot:CAMPEP_0114123194 /NCGR_PEP_ID=MMETSP0043_2-20121206/8094_1 /TAXON_ID=464988 /ORGANISM="Hemiselmis andersenii, Strain CCMP644" /LENGTH=95 /DNA_ID=CAMNT_0001215951 /DNA_START=62 /DNA_END=345 /DNA_ORIENTATION=-
MTTGTHTSGSPEAKGAAPRKVRLVGTPVTHKLRREPVDLGAVGGHGGIRADGDSAHVLVGVAGALAAEHARGEPVGQLLAGGDSEDLSKRRAHFL